MITIEASNIGGITETEVSLGDDVTILVGRNATNRTSLLQAMRVALGSRHTPIRSDAKQGEVKLNLEDGTYERELFRENGTVRTSGSPYLDDPAVADLFAFLLEDNPARRAIERGDDLRELLLRPVDVDEIESRIRDLQAEREEILDTLDELDSIEEERAQLLEQRERVEEELADVTDELQAVRDELATAEANIDTDGSGGVDADERVEQLRERRERLEEVQHTRETSEQSIASLKDEREQLTAQLEELSGGVGSDIADIESRLEQLRERQSRVDTTLNELHNVISFNDDLLDGARQEVIAAVGSGTSGENVTDGLLAADESVTCWTCGTDVDRDRIEETLDRLRDIQQNTFDRKRELENEIESLREKRREFRRTQQERERIESRLEEIEEEIRRHTDRQEGLAVETEQLRDEIEELEETIKADRDDAYASILELQREETDLSFERNRLETNLEEIENSLDQLDERLEEREALEERVDELVEEIENARTRVETIETETVDAFNSHMESILSLLDYENIERIWIERKNGAAPDDVEDGYLEVHIVRSTTDGAVYEDTIDHLSESEREVMGLVFALSGYLVYDIYEDVPFLLLDSLEAIDSERIAKLVGYFEEYAANLVVALLPEDAQALPDRYEYVTEI